LTLGPGITIWRYWHGELVAMLTGEFRHWGVLAVHVVLVTLVLIWVGSVAGMAIGSYLAMVYGGLSLTLMRSFLEHRPAVRQEDRTVIVEAGLVWRLLFLNNNLHVLHHGQPGLPWYALGRVYEANRERLRASNGGYVFAGYGDVARRYLVTPKDHPVIEATPVLPASA
ncbi:MAG: fatty acid desaturase, partial [Alphaproteobacteria bacterium]